MRRDARLHTDIFSLRSSIDRHEIFSVSSFIKRKRVQSRYFANLSSQKHYNK